MRLLHGIMATRSLVAAVGRGVGHGHEIGEQTTFSVLSFRFPCSISRTNQHLLLLPSYTDIINVILQPMYNMTSL